MKPTTVAQYVEGPPFRYSIPPLKILKWASRNNRQNLVF